MTTKKVSGLVMLHDIIDNLRADSMKHHVSSVLYAISHLEGLLKDQEDGDHHLTPDFINAAERLTEHCQDLARRGRALANQARERERKVTL